jgi:hypothetical protein
MDETGLRSREAKELRTLLHSDGSAAVPIPMGRCWMKRAGLVALSAIVVACGFPRETWAKDDPAKPRRGSSSYSDRERESHELEDFRGGCGPDGTILILAIFLSPVLLPAFGLYKLGEWVVSLFKVEKPCPPPRRTPDPERERRGVPAPAPAPIPGVVLP